MKLKLTQSEIGKIVLGYDLEAIKKKPQEQQDNEIHEIILECMAHEKAIPCTAKFDKLYQQYETIVYKIIKRHFGYKYHYEIYKLNSYLGRWELIDTAQDKFMLDCLKEKYCALLPTNQLSYKKVRISKEEWKKRYC